MIIENDKRKLLNAAFKSREDIPYFIDLIEMLLNPDYVFIIEMNNSKEMIIYQKNYRLRKPKGGCFKSSALLDNIPSLYLEEIRSLKKVIKHFLIEIKGRPFQYFYQLDIPIIINQKKMYLKETSTILSLNENGTTKFKLVYYVKGRTSSNKKRSLRFSINSYENGSSKIIDLKNRVKNIIGNTY